MKQARRKKLEAAGWAVGNAADFLGLSPEGEALVEMKLRLAAELRKLRAEQNVTQLELARRLGSSQSRVAKMEKADASFELLMRSLLTLGATPRQIGRTLERSMPSGNS